jgi:hypothetical protein
MAELMRTDTDNRQDTGKLRLPMPPIHWAVLYAALLALAPWHADAADQAVWELRPYKVAVRVATDGAPMWTPRRVEALVKSLSQSVAAQIGAAWQVETSTAAEPFPGDWPVAADALAASAGSAGNSHDKFILLSLIHDADGPAACAREWDVATKSAGPPIRRAIATPRELDWAAFRAVTEAFSPQARIRSAAGGRVTIRVRAGNVPLRDARQARCQPGAVLRLARVGGTSTPVALGEETFLLVDSTVGSEAVCWSYGRDPSAIADLAGPGSPWLALEASPTRRGNELVLVQSGSPAMPLAGYGITAQTPGGMPQPLGKTGRDGTVAIPAGASALQLIEVRGGESVLARFPMLIGWQPRVEFPLASDAALLAAGERIAALRARLADLAARRAVLLARAKARFAAGQADAAKQRIDEARALIAAEGPALSQAIDADRTQTPVAAPAMQPQIDRLWAALAAEAQAQLAPGPIDAVANQLFPPAAQ